MKHITRDTIKVNELTHRLFFPLDTTDLPMFLETYELTSESYLRLLHLTTHTCHNLPGSTICTLLNISQSHYSYARTTTLALLPTPTSGIIVLQTIDDIVIEVTLRCR